MSTYNVTIGESELVHARVCGVVCCNAARAHSNPGGHPGGESPVTSRKRKSFKLLSLLVIYTRLYRATAAAAAVLAAFTFAKVV